MSAADEDSSDKDFAMLEGSSEAGDSIGTNTGNDRDFEGDYEQGGASGQEPNSDEDQIGGTQEEIIINEGGSVNDMPLDAASNPLAPVCITIHCFSCPK